MFRNSSQSPHVARIASLSLATLLIVAAGTSLEAKGVTKLLKESPPSADLQFNDGAEPQTPSGETFTVQTWIPGFDDDEPVFTCAPLFAPSLSQTKLSNHARFRKLDDDDGCGVMLRMLPWNFQSIRIGSDEYFLPII